MKRKISHFGFCIVLIVFAGCSNKPIYTSTYISNEKAIDGQLTDWESEMQFDQKSKILYNVANDDSNLIVCFKVTEAVVKNKIMMRGLTVWVDTMGKQKKVLGIKYPMGRSGNERAVNQRSSQQAEPNRQQRAVRPGIPNRLELTGFSEKVNSEVVSFNSAGGVEVAIMEDPFGGMQYEAKIPMKYVLDDPVSFMSGTEKYLSIGFETGYVKMESNAGGGGPGGGGRGGGRPPGGGGRGGGGRPGGMATQSGDMAGMTQATRLWVKQVKLAKPDKQ